ncbi:acetolactate synthase-1/2/3 large subunit/5-guanidino-2-oxopentanoate decarboxylase [Rubricella aquisinus]|uniref:Acetolactate synthase-1/2/3 large subunit/5-guanidino-2-oxopentanoate decarboxylase n=1 Tax=Rubricella aquisinus TaxID=2028108 RepID=A0A840WR31_9RHOB|nr:5-guanidino-2-oxopentanoate decarboxylase [Rubricella aquisinus]MBB5516132.1 acetolactate synthase-1/2/3 large subunit/5-guanidino-2-oxopentanoate decarboxylase [Rubricella aquisinus]
MPTLGQRLAKALAARGVTTLFGIPGVHNVELYRGIEAAGLSHVLARHEQGAGFMADGYARVTGQPGVALVISGPGLTNIMTPMAQAWSDSVPMLVISATLEARDRGARIGRLHDMPDQEGAARAASGQSFTASTPAMLWDQLEAAFASFAQARPGPVHIQIPLDVLAAEAGPAPAPRPLPRRPGADAVALSDAARMIAAAKRPLMVLGGGAWSGAEGLSALSERASIPLFTTYAARGIAAPDHPMWLGATLARARAAEVFARADLVIAIGTELAETDLWRAHPGHDCPMIRVDIDPAQLSARHRADLAICADAGAFAGALDMPDESRSAWTQKEVRAWRDNLTASAMQERPEPARVIPHLTEALTPRSCVVSDMTGLAYLGKEVVPLPQGARWHHPFGFGTLGYGLPAAIGAKVADPAREVICIAGDYGLQYTIQELGTAVELGLGLPILLWDNAKLGEIEVAMQTAQMPPIAIAAQNPDFVALARAYGAAGCELARLRDLGAVLRDAFAADRPMLIRITPETPE